MQAYDVERGAMPAKDGGGRKAQAGKRGCGCRRGTYRRGACSLTLLTLSEAMMTLAAVFGMMTSFWIDPPTVSLGMPGRSVGVVHAGLFRVCYPQTLADNTGGSSADGSSDGAAVYVEPARSPLDAAWSDFVASWSALAPVQGGAPFVDDARSAERCTAAVRTHFYSNVYGEDYWPRVQAAQVLAPAFVFLGVLKLVLFFVVNAPGANDWPPFGVACAQVLCGLAVVSLYASIFADVVRTAPQGPVVVVTDADAGGVVIARSPDMNANDVWGWSFWTFASAVLSQLLGTLLMLC